jgi:hypothetical protein
MTFGGEKGISETMELGKRPVALWALNKPKSRMWGTGPEVAVN